jgi:hypothetical protein
LEKKFKTPIDAALTAVLALFLALGLQLQALPKITIPFSIVKFRFIYMVKRQQ